MKKIILLLTTLLSSALIATAQSGSGVRLGLTAHPNFGFLKIENGKSNGMSTGFAYGLISDFEFAENYSFATGITVTTINGSGTIVDYKPYHQGVLGSADYDVKFKMQYLEIPLSLKLKTDEMEGLKWYGQFGLTTDFNLSSRMDVKRSNVPLATDVKGGDNTSFFRAGMIIGGGAEYALGGKTSLVGGLTYNNGLTNIASKGTNVRNHYVAVNIGVFF